jgi:cyclic pyranopterin phosphate synthase
MPAQGVEWKAHEAMLSFEEIRRVCAIMAGLGIRKIKVTGGEALVRRGAVSFIKNLKNIPGVERVTLTTNGLLLGGLAGLSCEPFESADEALPDAVNISLNALDPGRYRRITRQEGSPGPEAILPLIDRLLERQIPVKINCVPVREYNEEDILPLAALAREKNIAVRFIELMPLGAAAALGPIPGGEIAALLEKAYGPLRPFSGDLGSGPALYYSLSGFAGKIGFINAMSHSFCENCNRLRLTSEGFLKLCLSSDLGLDIRALLRRGASEGELIQAVAEITAKKPRFHSFSNNYAALPKKAHSNGMSTIGG